MTARFLAVACVLLLLIAVESLPVRHFKQTSDKTARQQHDKTTHAKHAHSHTPVVALEHSAALTTRAESHQAQTLAEFLQLTRWYIKIEKQAYSANGGPDTFWPRLTVVGQDNVPSNSLVNGITVFPDRLLYRWLQSVIETCGPYTYLFACSGANCNTDQSSNANWPRATYELLIGFTRGNAGSTHRNLRQFSTVPLPPIPLLVNGPPVVNPQPDWTQDSVAGGVVTAVQGNKLEWDESSGGFGPNWNAVYRTNFQALLRWLNLDISSKKISFGTAGTPKLSNAKDHGNEDTDNFDCKMLDAVNPKYFSTMASVRDVINTHDTEFTVLSRRYEDALTRNFGLNFLWDWTLADWMDPSNDLKSVEIGAIAARKQALAQGDYHTVVETTQAIATALAPVQEGFGRAVLKVPQVEAKVQRLLTKVSTLNDFFQAEVPKPHKSLPVDLPAQMAAIRDAALFERPVVNSLLELLGHTPTASLEAPAEFVQAVADAAQRAITKLNADIAALQALAQFCGKMENDLKALDHPTAFLLQNT